MNNNLPYSAVILAGGNSSRMKTNKALLHLQGKEIIEIIIDRLRPYFSEILIISNHAHLYSHLNLPIYCDIILNRGPLAGIHSGLKNISTAGAFFVACDMPFLDPNLAIELSNNLKTYQIAVPKHNEYLQPLHAAYRKDCLDEIEIALRSERPKIKSFYNKVKVKYLDFKDHPQYNWDRIFFNVNTPEDYNLAQRF